MEAVGEAPAGEVAAAAAAVCACDAAAEEDLSDSEGSTAAASALALVRCMVARAEEDFDFDEQEPINRKKVYAYSCKAFFDGPEYLDEDVDTDDGDDVYMVDDGCDDFDARWAEAEA